MFKAKLLRILRLLPTHCFIQVIVEGAQGNAPGARIGGLTLQSIEQMGHEDAVPLLHLFLRNLSHAVRGYDDAPLGPRQIEERLSKEQACILWIFLLSPAWTGERNIQ